MGHFSFLLALRITVVRKVWLWLGEGRTLQNTEFLCRQVGTEEEGWQVDTCGSGNWGTLGRRKGREWLGQGQTGRHF